MKVADFWFQHSPMLGHCALSQTVCRFSSRAIFLRLWNVSPMGAFAFSHAGFGAGLRGVRSIWMSSDGSSKADGGIMHLLYYCAACNSGVPPPGFVDGAFGAVDGFLDLDD